MSARRGSRGCAYALSATTSDALSRGARCFPAAIQLAHLRTRPQPWTPRRKAYLVLDGTELPALIERELTVAELRRSEPPRGLITKH